MNKIYCMCPFCGWEANSIEEIERDFGFRISKGKKIPQSYCRVCRSGNASKNKNI